mgnify:CR=1 FL=1
MNKTICELFAGVGGFRLGFERADSGWETTWFSQWEPGARTQWANQCYVQHFGDSPDINGEFHTCEDISTVDKNAIPDHTLLVGGFPCQDYSVAQSLSSSKGIEGKKGVLWWQIRDTIEAKRPAFCIFENVDRLLKSPSTQRGRDFGIMLRTFDDKGYNVEWRVINAAEYGARQKRRRTFIFAWRKDTNYNKSLSSFDNLEIMYKQGVFAKTFPVQQERVDVIHSIDISNNKYEDTVIMTEEFKFGFENTGCMIDAIVRTEKTTPVYVEPTPLKDVLTHNVDESFYLNASQDRKSVV